MICDTSEMVMISSIRHLMSRDSVDSECKLLWDFSIVSDVSFQHNRPDINFVLKQSNEVFLIEIAIPGDSHLSHKCTEKHIKYVDLKIEVVHMWNSEKVAVVPIIVGALESILVSLSTYLEKLNLPSSLISTFQKSVLYSTTSIIRQ